ncbi:hypothetical protein GMB50_10545 [Turicibacter sanguinis]|nr:hypothetical protein [Turicibacter sanguinis]MTP47958.1 hypothetical protein [Turicibacter sanguinis]MTP50706.1 hypothetical protein [Turicibacter sanguinis]MTQ07942.1 hypothetical protein [Turicibacter sanguinis]
MVTRFKKAEVEFGEGVSPKGLASLFRNNLTLDRAEDGDYNGLTGKVTVKHIGNSFRLFVDVDFEDNQGNDVQLKYSNELDPRNYYIRKLFSDFKIDYQANELDLSPLSNTNVKIVVKNNGPYCNVIGMQPLKNESLAVIDYDNSSELIENDEDFELNLSLDDEEIDFTGISTEEETLYFDEEGDW